MRKFILLLTISISAFAASAQNNAKVTSAALRESKTSGVYVFHLSDKIGQTEVEKSSEYYKQYLNTTFDAAKHDMKVTLTENAEINKMVIQRLLVSLNVTEVLVDGKAQTYDKIYDSYLK